MSNSYGQYCPLALGAELLCQRWTILVVSRLFDGCTRFNQIRRGVPGMSPSLLSKRLSELEGSGVVRTRKNLGGKGREYHLTEAGRELEPLIETLAVWGHRWSRDMGDEDLDPAYLLWSMHRRVDTRAMPSGQTVVEFAFTGAPKDCRQFWLVNRDGEVEMCLKDPELEIDLAVSSDLRLFVEAWRGFRSLRQEIRAGHITLHGPERLCQTFPSWLLLSELASYERMRPGRERRLSLAAQTGDKIKAAPRP